MPDALPLELKSFVFDPSAKTCVVGATLCVAKSRIVA
jgi:hypothetical protein